MNRKMMASSDVVDSEGRGWKVELLGPEESADAIMFDFLLRLTDDAGDEVIFPADVFVGLFMMGTQAPPPA